MTGYDENGRIGSARAALYERLGWGQPAGEPADRARAALLALLVDEFGVNEAGVEVILHLLAQMHSLERRLDLIGRALRRLPPESQTLFEAEFRILCQIIEENRDE